MKKVLLSGGSGFIGGHLSKLLLEEKVEVTLLARNTNRVPLDIRNNARVIEYCPYYMTQLYIDDNYDCFFHLGWAGVGVEKKNDLDTQLKNIRCAVEALQFAKRNRIKKFISAGTVAEYVFCDDIIDLREKQSPNDYYGAAKVSAHFFLDVTARMIDKSYIWVVIPSTYGEGRIGKNIITYTIESLLQCERPQYGSLHQMWDFLYVDDVARALMLIGELGITGKTYGIGSGVYKPLKEYIEEIRDIVNPSAELGIGELPEMTTISFSSCVNDKEMRRDTGFTPRYSFEEGIKKTVEWYRERKTQVKE